MITNNRLRTIANALSNASTADSPFPYKLIPIHMYLLAFRHRHAQLGFSIEKDQQTHVQ